MLVAVEGREEEEGGSERVGDESERERGRDGDVYGVQCMESAIATNTQT